MCVMSVLSCNYGIRYGTCHILWVLCPFGLRGLRYRFLPYITASLLGRSPHNLIDIWVGGGVSEAGEIAQ